MGRWSPFVVSLSNHMSGSERPTVVMTAHAGIQRGGRGAPWGGGRGPIRLDRHPWSPFVVSLSNHMSGEANGTASTRYNA